MVEYANTLLISVCVQAITAANNAEKIPTKVTICIAPLDILKTGNILATR